MNYLARDSGVDAERTERTEAIMRELREGHQMPFPDFDEETRRGLMDQLEYPAKGCVAPGAARR